MGGNLMPELNATVNALFGSVIFVWCWRTWKRTGYRAIPALMATFGVWLYAAALARWWNGTYGPADWITWVQIYAWIPRLCAATALIWREALNGHFHPPDPGIDQLASELRMEITQIRNGG